MNLNMKTILPVAGALALASISIALFAQGRGGAPPAPMPAVLQNYQPVTAERLKNPEAGNWLMIRRTYDGWGYSPLDQITPANVAQAEARLGFRHRRAARFTKPRRWSTTA